MSPSGPIQYFCSLMLNKQVWCYRLKFFFSKANMSYEYWCLTAEHRCRCSYLHNIMFHYQQGEPLEILSTSREKVPSHVFLWHNDIFSQEPYSCQLSRLNGLQEPAKTIFCATKIACIAHLDWSLNLLWKVTKQNTSDASAFARLCYIILQLHVEGLKSSRDNNVAI